MGADEIPGYGNQTKTFVPRIQEAGIDTAIFSFYGLEGGPLVIDDIPIYPKLNAPYGSDVMHAHARHHFGKGTRKPGMLEDGLIVTLLDVWVYSSEVDPGIELFRAPARTAAWCPVDHEPTPPMVRAFFEQSDCVPIAMSRFGQRMLKEYDALYVPHGITTDVFRPVDRDQARDRAKLPREPFVVGMVAANKGNPSRKSFSEAIDAFARFRKTEQGKDAILYLHTEAYGKAGGVQLPILLQEMGLPADAVRFPDQYRYQCTGFDDDYMAHLFSSFDVLLNPAYGEGFGIPIIEAQACGTPVIVSDWSAMPEVGEVGWAVGGERFWSYQHSFMLRPAVDQIAWALGEAATQAERMRSRAREHGLKYDADLVTEKYMLPALAEAWRRCRAREPIVLRRPDLPPANVQALPLAA